MSFKLTAATETQLVYESPKEQSTRVAWLIVFTILTTAVVLNRLDPDFEIVAFVVFEVLFLLVGWFLLMILVFAPQGPHLSAPSRIIFDRSKGVMEIVSDTGRKDDSVIIPFYEVVKADLDVQARSNKNNDTITTYHLYIELITGGRWYLCSTSSQQIAEQWVKQLEVIIDRSVVPVTASEVKLPQRWHLESGAEGVLVSWTNPLGNRPWRLFQQALVLIAHFAGITYVIVLKSTSSEWLGSFAMISPFIVIIAWLSIRAIRRLIRDMITRFAIRISKEGFDYYEFSKEGGAVRNHIHLDLHNIADFRHTFAPERALPHDIVVIRKDMDDPVTLYTVLTPIERQRAVDWLRQQTARLIAH